MTQSNGAAEATDARPYPPGWPHLLADRLERLPGSIWVAYAVIALVAVLAMHLVPWTRDNAPIGTFDLPNTFWGILPVITLWLFRDVERAAATAFDAFRPALNLSEPELARLRYELTVIPDRLSLVITVVAVGFTLVSFALDPAGSDAVGLTGLPLVVVLVIQSFIVSVFFQLICQVLRQLRQIRRTVARSAVVDLFQPGPMHAFSRFTSRFGISIVLIVGFSVALVPTPTDFGSFLLSWAPYLVIPPIVVVIAFVVPLYGMHGRLVAEKEQMQGRRSSASRACLPRSTVPWTQASARGSAS
ncbi:MAG: hypothetical protein HW391_1058 [Chloroflexi bacterium]|nr:hypothetical protein [Chloroflexota bacterium]